MNLRIVLILSVLLFLAAMGAGFAYPSLVGPTGLAVHPTADVPNAGQVDSAVDFQNTKDFFGDVWLGRTTFGATDRLEVSLGYMRAEGETRWDTGHMWQVAAKYLLLDRPEDDLKVSAGAGYLKFNADWEVSGSGCYVVASKYLHRAASKQPGDINVRGHLGVVYGGFKEHEPGFHETGTLFKPWLGLELIGQRGTDLALEWRPRTAKWEDHDIVAVTLRHPVDDKLSVEVGTTNLFSDGASQAMFAGVAYCFDKGEGK
jgi:hypothetical protein